VPTRLQIKGPTLEGLETRVLNKFPLGARIVAAEKVTEGGIAGFLARHYFEAIVEIPDSETSTPAVPALPVNAHSLPPRAGVAALLQDADNAEDAMRGGMAAREELPTVSTVSGEFDALLDGLAGTTGQAAPSEAPDVPAVLAGPGDAVMVIGLGSDALAVARSMAASAPGSLVRTAGAFRADGHGHLLTRTGLTSVRAEALIAGRTLFVAFGLNADGTVPAAALTEMNADQIWLAVDATRKHSDTVAWTRRAGWASPAYALAVLNSQNTLTPQSVNDLQLPIGWCDDRRAHRTVL
jgi:hypothetical protein